MAGIDRLTTEKQPRKQKRAATSTVRQSNIVATESACIFSDISTTETEDSQEDEEFTATKKPDHST